MITVRFWMSAGFRFCLSFRYVASFPSDVDESLNIGVRRAILVVKDRPRWTICSLILFAFYVLDDLVTGDWIPVQFVYPLHSRRPRLME